MISPIDWRDVVGYEGVYEVSSDGQVRSVERLDSRGRRRAARPRALTRQKSGHLVVALSRNGAQKSIGVHRLVLQAFVGPCPEGMEACHWNDVPDDNRVENLRWDTRAANIADSVRNGTHHMTRVTHCPQGHEYSASNTYRYPGGNRACNECRREYREAHAEERRVKGREYARKQRAAQPPKAPRTHCKRGHEFTPENTYATPTGRSCLTCKREKAREHYERNRETYIAKAANWRQSNLDRAREQCRESQRRYRARKATA